jgi:hypothetical protein
MPNNLLKGLRLNPAYSISKLVAGSNHHEVFPVDDGQYCTPEQIFRSVLSGRVQGDHVVRPSKQPSFETAAVAPYRRRVVPLVRLKRSTRLSRLRASA